MAFNSFALLCGITLVLALITSVRAVPAPLSAGLRVAETKVKRSGVFWSIHNGNVELLKGVKQANSTSDDTSGDDKKDKPTIDMDNGKNDTNKIDDSPDATPDGIDDTNKDDKTGDNKVDDKEDKKDDKTDDNKTDDTNDDKKDDDDEDDEDDDGGISPGQNPGSRNLSAEGGSDAVCFPGTATVQLASGARKMMSELAVGDRVQVSPAQFSEVFMFTHKMAHVQHEFVTLRTAAGPTLSLTSMHYIHSNGALVAAGSVQVGDALELADGSVSRVVEVTVAQLTGLYNPQTVHGSIVVDGVLASTYTAAVRPKAAHAMLAPLRALYHRIAFVTKAGEKGGGGFVQYFPRGGVHEAL